MCPKIMNKRNSRGGKPLKFLDQDFDFLQDYCLKNALRFVDEFFPPSAHSIGEGLLTRENMMKIEWIRPKVITPNAEFVVGGVSRFDYAQGNVGNCWFLASVGALTFQYQLFHHIVPPGQSLSHNYAGIFHFRFGKWYDVVIDDKLPTINGRLVFVQSKTNNEFWPALLEKAYAKVCGSYADMHSGRVSEALLDFTGGVHIHYELKSAPIDLWETMYRASHSDALMGCESPIGDVPEEKLPNGIVLGHAYTVTGVYQAMSGRNPVKLVRLFNPWGDTEWNGDWSDNSPLWNTVSEKDRKELLVADNGEETFCTNPQFWLKVNGMGKNCEDGHNNILVSLIQIPDKRNRRCVSVHAIGFSVFAIPPEMRSEGKLGANFFHNRKPVETSGHFENVRQVMKFFRLEPGQYLIVPSTNTPNKTAEFFLSIFCKNEIHIE